MLKAVFSLSNLDEKNKKKAMDTVIHVPGFETIYLDMEEGKLTLTGMFDVADVARKLEKQCHLSVNVDTVEEVVEQPQPTSNDEFIEEDNTDQWFYQPANERPVAPPKDSSFNLISSSREGVLYAEVDQLISKNYPAHRFPPKASGPENASSNKESDTGIASTSQPIDSSPPLPLPSVMEMPTREEIDKAPTQEEIDKATSTFQNCLQLEFEHLLQLRRHSEFLHALDLLIASKELTAEKTSNLEKFTKEFPSLVSKFERSNQDMAKYKALISKIDTQKEELRETKVDYEIFLSKEQQLEEEQFRISMEMQRLEDKLKILKDKKALLSSKRQELSNIIKTKQVLLQFEINVDVESKKKAAENDVVGVSETWDSFRKGFI